MFCTVLIIIIVACHKIPFSKSKKVAIKIRRKIAKTKGNFKLCYVCAAWEIQNSFNKNLCIQFLKVGRLDEPVICFGGEYKVLGPR